MCIFQTILISATWTWPLVTSRYSPSRFFILTHVNTLFLKIRTILYVLFCNVLFNVYTYLGDIGRNFVKFIATWQMESPSSVPAIVSGWSAAHCCVARLSRLPGKANCTQACVPAVVVSTGEKWQTGAGESHSSLLINAWEPPPPFMWCLKIKFTGVTLVDNVFMNFRCTVIILMQHLSAVCLSSEVVSAVTLFLTPSPLCPPTASSNHHSVVGVCEFVCSFVAFVLRSTYEWDCTGEPFLVHTFVGFLLSP